jgi:ABC-type transport system involved in multi-copper enzyme maturation permease subunit
MSILSIAERELRVAARKRTVYAVRTSVALIGFGFSACALWVVTLQGFTPVPGYLLFQVLSWLTFGCACLIGATLTADSISEEKREGTLALLFLANLRPYSIALGKLASHGLVALYAVIGAIPVIAIPTLMGGSDLYTILKTALVLVFTILLALTLGLFASMLSRKAWAGSALSVSLLGFLTMAIPAFSSVFFVTGHVTAAFVIGLFSPSYLLAMAGSPARTLSTNYFWTSFAIQVGMLLILLLIVCCVLARVWKDRPASPATNPFRKTWFRLKHGSGTGRIALRKALLAINPILWLSARQPYASSGFVLFVCLVGITISVIGAYQSGGTGRLPDQFAVPLIMWLWFLPMLYVIFCFRLAVAASDRFAADRKTGALELLLSTRMTLKQIIRGQWLAVARQLWGGALVLLLLHGFVLQYILEGLSYDFRRPCTLREVIRGTVLHLLGRMDLQEREPFYIAPLVIVSAGFLIVILWIALGWVAMFMGLRTEKQVAAPWSAMVLLSIPPLALFVAFAAIVFTKDYFANDIFIRMLALGFGGFCCVLGNALFWLFFCRWWIYRNFRQTVSERQKPKGLFRLA